MVLATCRVSIGSAIARDQSLRLTRSRSIVTSGATRMKSLLQKSYLGLRSSSMKVTKAPHGCGRWTIKRSRRVLVITSRKRSSLTSRKRWRRRELNQWVCAFGYRRCNPIDTRRWCCPGRYHVSEILKKRVTVSITFNVKISCKILQGHHTRVTRDEKRRAASSLSLGD